MGIINYNIMEPPHLGTVPFFSIPPYVTKGELELKLDEVGLASNELVRTAFNEAEATNRNEPPRNSGVHVLEEHIYPVARLALEYQIFQQLKGSPAGCTNNSRRSCCCITARDF